MDNPLSKVALDHWYQVVMVAGIFVFILAGAGLLKAFPVVPTALVSFGFFWVGLGEWANHPLQTKLHPIGIVRGHPRNPKPIGIVFDIVGLVLICFGAYKFIA